MPERGEGGAKQITISRRYRFAWRESVSCNDQILHVGPMALAADYRFDATATVADRDTPASMVVCRRDRQAHPLPAGAVLPAVRARACQAAED